MSSTIAAISTPNYAGGISMIRISGDDAVAIADKVFKARNNIKLSQLEGYKAAYGDFFDSQNNLLDDGVALVYLAPKSYTGENVVEFTCHGGIYLTQTILKAVYDSGAKPALAGEFSKRAFLNGKLNLTQAESIMDLINSQNMQSIRSAKSQMQGNLYKKISMITKELTSIAAHLSAWVDYPEDDIIPVDNNEIKNNLCGIYDRLLELVDSFDKGKILNQGISTAIVGKPNVGKSTLMNLLSGYKKSIVTEIAGTTRDVVEETVNIGKIILKLADTAGIRETDDVVEKFGVELALDKIKTAQLILAVFDASNTLSEEDYSLIENLSKQDVPMIAIINKTDLDEKIQMQVLQDNFKHIVYTSDKNTQSINVLSEKIEDLLGISNFDTTSGIIVNQRQQLSAKAAVDNVKMAIDNLDFGMTLDAVNVDIEIAIENLLELSGEKVTDTVVNEVFHNFCVGK